MTAMDLDLDRMLELTNRGQWSVDDIDWSRPMEGVEHMSERARFEAGQQLLFTAGLERQAARVFALCAHYIDEPRAAEIYRLFEADEIRHAEAEERLAARYGVSWSDLPIASRWMFKQLAGFMEHPTRGHHELSSATILLFELALDSLLIPALKGLTSDPIQTDVFRRIDQDESRHLAMDYWLLDRKGSSQAGKTFREIIEEAEGRHSKLDRVRGRVNLARTLVTFIIGFGAMSLATKSLRDEMSDPKRIAHYLKRVAKVPERAPRAMDVPGYRMGLTGQKRIMALLFRVQRVGTAKA
jgi:hypothetical protein